MKPNDICESEFPPSCYKCIFLHFRAASSGQLFDLSYCVIGWSLKSDGPIDFEGADLDLDLNADDLNMEAEMMEVPSPNDD